MHAKKVIQEVWEQNKSSSFSLLCVVNYLVEWSSVTGHVLNSLKRDPVGLSVTSIFSPQLIDLSPGRPS